MTHQRSFCRLCPAGCGMIITTCNKGLISEVRPDSDNALSEGYACFKGLAAASSHASANRTLQPSKKCDESGRIAISSAQSIQEIAHQLSQLIDQYGPDAVAVYCGNSASLIPSAYYAHHAFLNAIGSSQYFSTVTIDHSSKYISSGRLGFWSAGHPSIQDIDLAVLVGANPVISHAAIGIAHNNPTRRIKREKERGLELVVIDPRKTETAHYANQHLRIKPGEDVALAGALLKLILEHAWHDPEFCEAHLKPNALNALASTLAPFSPEFAETVTGIEAGMIYKLAHRFARDSQKGFIYTSTGVSFSPHSNLAQHLYDCINVVCGRFLREGDVIHQSDVLKPLRNVYAGVTPPGRPWRSAGKSRIRGAYSIFGERPTATLSDEILTGGKGKIRALIVDGGDPLTAFPESGRTNRALAELDLLVCIDPVMSSTAEISSYHLPSMMQYERADITALRSGVPLWPGSWAQYTAPVASQPEHADLVEDWYVFWKLCEKMGKAFRINNQKIHSDSPPDIDEIHAAILRGAAIGLPELKQHPSGKYFDSAPRKVQAARNARHRFDILPDDVRSEIDSYLAEKREVPAERTSKSGGSFILTSRRTPDLVNSTGRSVDAIQNRVDENFVFMHPDDMASCGWPAGQDVQVVSEYGSCLSRLAEDTSMLPGTISLAHGWPSSPLERGPSNVNNLTSCTDQVQAINAMPVFTGLHVSVYPALWQP